MDKTHSISVEKTPDLPLAAFAITKFNAKLIGSESTNRKVYFLLELGGVSLIDITDAYEGDGDVCARKFASEFRRLRGTIRKAMNEQDLRGRRQLS